MGKDFERIRGKDRGFGKRLIVGDWGSCERYVRIGLGFVSAMSRIRIRGFGM